MKSIVNYNNEYNFFTDSSNIVLSTKLNKEVRIASSGVLCTQGDSSLGCINNIYINQPDYFGEIAAINQAVNWCKLISDMQMNNQNIYNIFSDSKSSIDKITIFVNKLIDREKEYIDTGKYKKIKQKKFSHLDILAFAIARIIVNYRLLIRLIYVPGHTKIDTNTDNAIKQARKKIIELNNGTINKNISNYTIHYILLRNNIIDGYTRENLIKNKDKIMNDISHVNLKELQKSLGHNIPIIWPYSFENRIDYFDNNNISQNLLNENNNYYRTYEGDKLKCICQRMI